MKRITLMLVMFLVTLGASGQQRSMMRGGEEDQRPSILFFEAVNLFSGGSSLSRLDLHYRIDQSFFIAVRNQDPSPQSEFICRGEVLIELLDSLEVSRARSIQQVEAASEHSDRELPGKKWYRNIASFELPPGQYKIVFEINDLESERRFVEDKSTVRLKRFAGTSSEMSTPLFVTWQGDNSDAHVLDPIGFGPNLLFGKKAALFIEVPSGGNINSAPRVEYTVASTSLLDHSTSPVVAETLSHVASFPHVQLAPERHGDESVYEVSSNDSSRAVGLLIPLASEKLPLRRFELAVTIHLGQHEYKTTKSFHMVWPDMPFSLRDIDYAINALKYITTDDQRDSLRTGNLEERRDNLEAFWKRKDPTPATAYNEMMVEYYRRVDHASRTFGTLHDPDGFKSDRGRTYILYGPPTSTDRNLDPVAGYQEVWTYENLGKKFIFADQTKTGNYVLISSQSL